MDPARRGRRRRNPYLAMAGRIEVYAAGRATGVHYHREGAWRARNVVVAGYTIETPQLLLNSATDRYPDGLANSFGLIGRYLTVQANQAVWGLSKRESARTRVRRR
jgi:choline dehydrogenase-like flavoprotein